MYLDRTVYIYIVHTCSITHTHIYICTYIYTIFVIMYVAICCMYMLCFHGEPHKMGSIPKILWHPWWVSHRRAQDLACWDSPIRLGLTYLGEFRFFTGEDYMIRFDRFHWEILEWHDEFGEDFMIFEINGSSRSSGLLGSQVSRKPQRQVELGNNMPKTILYCWRHGHCFLGLENVAVVT